MCRVIVQNNTILVCIKGKWPKLFICDSREETVDTAITLSETKNIELLWL